MHIGFTNIIIYNKIVNATHLDQDGLERLEETLGSGALMESLIWRITKEGEGLLRMSQVEVAIGTNEQRPRFAGEIHWAPPCGWCFEQCGGREGWTGGLEPEGHQLPDWGFKLYSHGNEKGQRFLNRDRACRTWCVRKIQALSLVAVWRIKQRQGETGDRWLMRRLLQ